MAEWLPYQRRFLAAVADPRYRTVALSMPRGGGKTTLAGHIVARALTPGDPLYVAGGECVLFAGSIEQCRLTYRQAIAELEAAGRLADYRLVDSATRVAITHKASRTRLKAIGSNPKTSLGLVGVPLAILDEPAALHTTGGTALWHSIRTAQGKVGSPLKVILTGTLAPAEPESWWPRLVEGGSRGSTWVHLLQGRSKKWKQWREVLRVNPLARQHAEMRDVLREELDEAKSDTSLAAAFKSYRLNLPADDELAALLDADAWRRVLARPVPERSGQPVFGIDLGGSRSWSAVVSVWRSGRCAALACAPGVPSIADQEKRDSAPPGAYAGHVRDETLMVAEGLQVPPVKLVVTEAMRRFGAPSALVCDRYRFRELVDATDGRLPVVPRVGGWKDSTEDIRAFTRAARDGALAVEPASAAIITGSLADARVAHDGYGNQRLRKRRSGNRARDDVAQALVHAAAHASRIVVPGPLEFEVL